MDNDQLTFWDELITEENTLWTEVYTLKEKQNNMRRGLFSRYEFMKKELCTLRAELDELRSTINHPTENKIFSYKQLRESTG